MSKIVFICFKDSKQNPYSNRDIEILSRRLLPDNITHPSPKIIKDDGILIGIFNPSDTLPIHNTSVCMGNLISAKDNWWKPGAEVPDGSYALFRSDEKRLELVTDILASRTIWYAKTKNMFIGATSERAIIFFLQDFKPNKVVYPWMLSAGTLGLGNSWDRRIKWLSGDSQLQLNRKSWKIKITKETKNFQPLNQSKKEHEIQFKEALESSFKNLNLDYSKWFLTLSGGYDSRAILLMLNVPKNLKCITWGRKSALNKKYNDAYIAKEFADYFNLDWEYWEINISKEPLATIFNRFIIAGEGRIDSISGYMDGLDIWKELYEHNIKGIIRGDEGFGLAYPVTFPDDVRRYGQAHLASDFSNLKCFSEFSLEEQKLPYELLQQKKETLETWRERLYQEFKIPTGNAALNDIKCSYLEVINPFITRKIIYQIRALPDSLRTDKKIFKKYIESISPKIGFAKYEAIKDPKYIFKSQEFVNLIMQELNTSNAKALLSEKLIEYILKNIKKSNETSFTIKNALIEFLTPYIPWNIQNILRNTVMKPQMDFNVLAFRAYIICRMNRILSEDANALDMNH